MALDPDQHRLPEDEHQAIFEKEIIPALFDGTAVVQRPVAVILGGQPGAGKSPLVEAATVELMDRGGVAEIVGDDLRDFHPRYRSLLQQDDRTAAFYTDRDSGRWVEKAIEQAKARSVNLIIEGTMRSPDVVAATMTDLRGAGYRIDARVLAVNERLSIQGIMQRYEGQRQARGFGRMTTPEAHQAGYDGVLRSVDRIERDGLADTISVYRRGAIKIYENEMTPQGWQREPFARAAIEAERARPFSIEEAAQYLAGYDRLADVISRPERAATPAERQQIEGLRIAARQEFEGVAVAADRSARFLRTDQADAGRHPDLRPAFERLALVQAALTSAGISGEARDATMAQARQRIADELATGRELRPVSLTDGPPAPRIRR